MGGLEEKVFGRLPDATWIYPGPRQGLHSRGEVAPPGGVARAGLVEHILA
jgi:hypothetical protein